MAHEIDDITGIVVDAAYKIHTVLGPGLLESVYEAVLARELERRGLSVQRQLLVAFEFEGMHFDEGFRVDLLVEGVVVLELKSVERLAPVHSKQLLTYLRLLHLPVGLLINFGNATLKEGLHRIVNNYVPSPSAPPRERSVAMKVGSRPAVGLAILIPTSRLGGSEEAHAEALRRGEREGDMMNSAVRRLNRVSSGLSTMHFLPPRLRVSDPSPSDSRIALSRLARASSLSRRTASPAHRDRAAKRG